MTEIRKPPKAEPSLKDLGLDAPVAPVVHSPLPKLPNIPGHVEPEVPRRKPEEEDEPEIQRRTLAFNSRKQADPMGPSLLTLQHTLMGIGLLLAFFGFLLMIFFGVCFDTSVVNEVNEGSRIHNLGLQQDRLIGFLGGTASWMLGMIMATLARLENTKR